MFEAGSIAKTPVKTFVEMGPGKSLSGMIKRIKDKPDCVSIQTLGDL